MYHDETGTRPYGAMDNLLPPCYPPCFMSPFSADDHHQNHPAPEFLSCDALEKWLLDNDDVLANHENEDPQDDTGSSLPPPPAAAAPLAKRKRGRKPGFRSGAADTITTTTITHVEAERQRRDRLNRLFCDLRAAVPTVSRMDRASLLADAVGYINKLRSRVEQLEAEAGSRRTTMAASLSQLPMPFGGSGQEELEVRMHGRGAAALRLTTTAARHAPARLMAALRALDLPVLHASVCRVGGVTVQDVIVDMGAAAGLWGEDCLRTALLHKLLKESG